MKLIIAIVQDEDAGPARDLRLHGARPRLRLEVAALLRIGHLKLGNAAALNSEQIVNGCNLLIAKIGTYNGSCISCGGLGCKGASKGAEDCEAEHERNYFFHRFISFRWNLLIFMRRRTRLFPGMD